MLISNCHLWGQGEACHGFHLLCSQQPPVMHAVCQELGPGPSTCLMMSATLQMGRLRLWGLGHALGTQDK